MSGFVGHTTTNAVVAVGTTAFMWWQGWSVGDIVAVDAGIAISSLILSPDMDLFTSRSMEDWGIMRLFWWPYAKIVKHRDRLHTPILGTSVRWVYTLVILGILILPFALLVRNLGFRLTFSGETDDVVFYLLYLLDVFIGANLADASHFALDMISTGFKEGLGAHHHHARYPLAFEERDARRRYEEQHHYQEHRSYEEQRHE
jgi:uncharacterized metal-binding protein